MKYYIAKISSIYGPYSLADFKSLGIKIFPETFIWYESLEGWKEAKEIIEFKEIIDFEKEKNSSDFELKDLSSLNSLTDMNAKHSEKEVITNQKKIKKIILTEGTEIEIKLIEELDSKNARLGDPVRLKVNEDIYCNNILIIRQGTKVKASGTVAEKRGMLGKAGKVDFSLNSIATINNREIPVRAVKSNEGKNRQVGVIAGTLLLTPLFLLMKGKDIKIEAGKIFTAFVDDDIELEISE